MHFMMRKYACEIINDFGGLDGGGSKGLAWFFPFILEICVYKYIMWVGGRLCAR